MKTKTLKNKIAKNQTEIEKVEAEFAKLALKLENLNIQKEAMLEQLQMWGGK